MKGLDLCRYVAGRGYKAQPLMNTLAAADGAQLKVMAYQLAGPRGNRTTVAQDRDGEYSFDAVKLWCDGVDYATSRLKRAPRRPLLADTRPPARTRAAKRWGKL